MPLVLAGLAKPISEIFSSILACHVFEHARFFKEGYPSLCSPLWENTISLVLIILQKGLLAPGIAVACPGLQGGEQGNALPCSEQSPVDSGQ